MRLSTIPSGLATLDGAAAGQLLVVRGVLADDDGLRASTSQLAGQTVRCREVRPDAVRIELAGGCTIEVPMSSARRIHIEPLEADSAAGMADAEPWRVSIGPSARRLDGPPREPRSAGEKTAEPRRLARPAEHRRLAPLRERRRLRDPRRSPAGPPAEPQR